MTEPLLVIRADSSDGVVHLTLDDPATRNALSDRLLDHLSGHLADIAADPDARVVVLGSTGRKVFSSGGDLKAFADDRDIIDKYQGLDRFPALYQQLLSLRQPTICAAGGDVLAGAFGLALACDLVIARRGISFACPEINVGVFPFMISALIYRNVPRMKANELMMTGRPIDADAAAALGFVNAVVDEADLDDEVAAWASSIARKSPLLMGLGKRAIDDTRDQALGDALAHLKAQLALAFTTRDIREGVAAFREKREPDWNNR